MQHSTHIVLSRWWSSCEFCLSCSSCFHFFLVERLVSGLNNVSCSRKNDSSPSSTKDNIEVSSLSRRFSDHIVTLKNSSIVSSVTGVELTEARYSYIADWRLWISQTSCATPANLRTPQDVYRYWEERKAAYLEAREVGEENANVSDLDLEIKFLSSKTVNELLAQQETPAAPRQFTHINSICVFADGKRWLSWSVECVEC